MTSLLSSRARRRRQRCSSSFAAVAVTLTASSAILLSCCTSTIGVHAGLLRSHVGSNTIDATSSAAAQRRALPQHGAQCPHRPLHLPPHMLPPPLSGADQNERRLWLQQQQQFQPNQVEGQQQPQHQRRLPSRRSSKGRKNINNIMTNNDDGNNEKSRKNKIKAENDKRHEANQKLKDKRKNNKNKLKGKKTDDKPKRNNGQQKKKGGDKEDKKDRLKQKMSQLKDKMKDEKLTKEEKKELLKQSWLDNDDNSEGGKKKKKDKDKEDKKIELTMSGGNNQEEDEGRPNSNNSNRPGRKPGKKPGKKDQGGYEKPRPNYGTGNNQLKPKPAYGAVMGGNKPSKKDDDDKPIIVPQNQVVGGEPTPEPTRRKPKTPRPTRVKNVPTPEPTRRKPKTPRPTKVQKLSQQQVPVVPQENDEDKLVLGELDTKLQNAGVTPSEASKMSIEEKEEYLLLTDGQFQFDFDDKYIPPVNTGAGGGVTNLNLENVSPPTPKPTHEPTRRPKKPNKIDNDDDGDTKADVSNMEFNSEPANSVVTTGGTTSNKWNFVNSLTDNSLLIDDFEEHQHKLNWKVPAIDPWVRHGGIAYKGTRSMTSGISSSTYYETSSQPIYSNLTLSTNKDFDGGVVSFMILAKSLILPIEAFYVLVDGNVALSPDVTAKRSNSLENIGEWVEYSVPVGRGKHDIRWVHVYNPFGLQSLPPVKDENYDHVDNVGLWMDELRYTPFTFNEARNNYDIIEHLDMINPQGLWSIIDNGNKVVTYTQNIQEERDGHADISFILYSEYGGILKYRIQSSTTAPHDDFAIVINDVVVDAMFGNMLGYEVHSLEIPSGKQMVTLRHRKNPGGLGSSLLKSLGEVGTEGKTWLENLTFDPYF